MNNYNYTNQLQLKEFPDVGSKNYHAFLLLFKKDGSRAVLMQKKEAGYGLWCLIHDNASLYFNHYSEAIQFCHDHGYTARKGGDR